MTGDQIASFVFLALLGVAILGSYMAHSRLKGSQMAQQAMIWVLIFVGAIAAAGLWQDMKGDLTVTQAVVSENVIEVPRGRDGHFHLDLQVNGVTVPFLVDTGATQVVLTRRDAARAGLDPEDLNFIGTAYTANGEVRIAPVVLDRVALGPIQDRNLRASVNGGQMEQSLLGMTYLNRFERIEIQNNRLLLAR
ncbi:MAG: TIGR02281 family clan AA aspartic protease [Salibaculum sp.]|jgi:aspartyl protease family protein|uniref:retropepsin-like aspartic protease family protein n=1 Tax=Roseovarius halophilus (ex Wu et al. 2025) TaxID=3376060 RepID=UPI00287086F0|nr:TIGR02281 family clan AA aspartic protease [Salibaculum sp.]MDR9428751.1 TIGR02281 family clan AA aspartic protease [Salibaculum sp.]MDR9483208.1 TIGR02281 family clan AA aspartic protease [Salibaculum sp.]